MLVHNARTSSTQFSFFTFHLVIFFLQNKLRVMVGHSNNINCLVFSFSIFFHFSIFFVKRFFVENIDAVAVYFTKSFQICIYNATLLILVHTHYTLTDLYISPVILFLSPVSFSFATVNRINQLPAANLIF